MWREGNISGNPTDSTFLEKHCAYGWKAGSAISAVLVIAAVLGSHSGIRAGHQARLDALNKQMSELAKTGAPTKQRFMELARRNTKNLPDYLERCTELESAINDYESAQRQMDDLLSQAQQQAQALNVGTRYDDLLTTFSVMKSILNKDLESEQAYRKEIMFAKQLPSLPESDRLKFYTAKIQPIVEQETRIATEEVEIIKAAKARGVNLSQNLYSEAGIN